MSNYSKSNPNLKTQKIYDLEERTAIFGENVVEFCKSLPQNNISIPYQIQI